MIFRFCRVDRLNSSLVVTLALLLLLATPGHPSSLLRGFPLEPIVTSIALPLAFLVWGGRGSPTFPGQRWLIIGIVVIALLKSLLAVGAPEPGALASYFGRARLTDPPERSLDFRQLKGATRIDRVLDFDQGSLPVGFFNDNDRFNFYQPGHPDRQRLALAAVWDSWISVPVTRSYRLWVTAIGDASLDVDGAPALSVSDGLSTQPRSDARPMELVEGPHEIRLTYQRRQDTPALISLEWDVDGERGPVGPPYLYTTPVSSETMSFEAMRGQAARGLDLLALALALMLVLRRWIAAGHLSPSERQAVERDSVPASPASDTVRRLAGTESRSTASLPGGEGTRLGLALWAAAITAYGVITSQSLVGRTTILEGGQDWLTYEYYARDILLNGPLMTLGKALGQGRAFVFQPLYPYYLAALHALFGEGIFGPQVAHFAGFGIAGIVLFFIARVLFGTLAAWVTLALMTALIFTQLDVVARRLLSENLYFFVLPAALLGVLFAGRTAGWPWPVISGALMGIACLTRAPTLLIAPVAILVLVLNRHGAGALVFAAVTCLVVSLTPIRNYVVSGRPTLVATNAGATLLLAHPLTEKVRLRGLDEHPLYNRLGLDRPTREMLEFVIQDPSGYAATLVPLAAYTVGFPGMVEPGSPPAWDLIALLALYLIALALLPSARQRDAWLSHAFIVSHFLVMITFLPYVYGYRQVLPMYVVMLPFCAALVTLFGDQPRTTSSAGWRRFTQIKKSRLIHLRKSA